MGANDVLALLRRRSVRLQEYNYAQDGGYFVTLCTEDRENWFGEIVGGEMILNDFGLSIAEEWARTPYLRPNAILDEYVVMPNHLHGIIFINGQNHRDTPSTQHLRRGVLHTPAGSPIHATASGHDAARPITRDNPNAVWNRSSGRMQYAPTNAVVGDCGRMQYAPTMRSPSQTLGAIVRGFKATTTKRVQAMCGTTRLRLWQRNYYEHIIRNDADLDRIRSYIANNPARWAEDENNLERES